MRKLLAGWELGAGAGHVQRLAPVLKAFLASGWNVTFASRNVSVAKAVLAAQLSPVGLTKLDVVQAPIFTHKSVMRSAPRSFAESLANMGFASVEKWSPAIRGWRQLLDNLRPDSILADTSPSLISVARGRLPIGVVGNGWTIPPTAPRPVAFPGNLERDQESVSASNRILEALAQLFPSAQVRTFDDILRGDANFICSLPELDPYRRQRAEPLYWPPEIAVPSSSSSQRLRGFCYLPRGHPAIPLVTKAVELSGIPFDMYLGGDTPNSGMSISDKPLDLAKLLPTCGVAIHHGGQGTAIWCFLNRTTQLICCTDGEKRAMSESLRESRAGVAFHPNTSASRLAQMLLAARLYRPPPPDLSELATCNPSQTLEGIIRALS